jgi:hypothetical protein
MSEEREGKRPWQEPTISDGEQVPPPGGEIVTGGHAGGKTEELRERVAQYMDKQGRRVERIEWTGPAADWFGAAGRGEMLLAPREWERLGASRFAGVPGYGTHGGPVIVGVDVASGPDQTVVVMRRGTGEPTVRQLWRAVRWRNFVRARVVFEPRDWWAGMYGPKYDKAEGVVYLYFGLLLPWVLRLTFEGGEAWT